MFKSIYELKDKDFKKAVVTYKESSLPGYSEKERSYWFSKDNNYFKNNKISNALVGHCLDETESIRLDYYIGTWKVEKVVIVE